MPLEVKIPELTHGAVRKMYYSSPDNIDENHRPLVQLLSVKPAGDPIKYRVIVSDGSHFTPGVFATSMNHFVDEGRVERLRVIRIEKYSIAFVQNKRVVVISRFTPLKDDITDKIGNPRTVDPSNKPRSDRPPPSSSAFSSGAYDGPSASFSSQHHPSAPLAPTYPPPAFAPAYAPPSRGGFSGGRGQGGFPIGGGRGQAPPPPVAAGRGGGGDGMLSGVFGAGRGVGRDTSGPFGTRGGMTLPIGSGQRGSVAPRGGFVNERGGAPGGQRGGMYAGGGGRGGMQQAGGGGRGGVQGRERVPRNFHPIESLTPYQAGRWAIRGRVTQKSEIKTWSNARGEGKLFSMTLMDETGEIKCTGFGEMVDNWHAYVEDGKAYRLAGGKIAPAKKNFSTVDHEFEITIDKNTDITLVEDDHEVPQIQYNFVTLDTLEDKEKDSTCDVLVVMTEVGEIGSITAKATGKEVAKRDLTVVDRSGYSCRLSLWGKTAETFNAAIGSILAVRAAKVGDFRGKTLSMGQASSMQINPIIDEAHPLRGWFDSLPPTAVFKTHASTNVMGAGFSNETLTASEVETRGLGRRDKPDYFNLKGTIAFVKSDKVSYPAHGGESGCQKKVVEDGHNWRCDKCDVIIEAPEHRYIVSMLALDHTGQIWLSGFNDVGCQLFGMSADEMEQVLYENPDAGKLLADRCKSKVYLFRCSARSSIFQDTETVKYSIQSASEFDFAAEGRALMDRIRAYGVAC